MKKVLFSIASLISICSYFFAGSLLALHFTDNAPGMALVFLVPLLLIGLLTGVIAFFIIKIKGQNFGKYLVWLHYLNSALILLGIIALVYVFLN